MQWPFKFVVFNSPFVANRTWLMYPFLGVRKTKLAEIENKMGENEEDIQFHRKSLLFSIALYFFQQLCLWQKVCITVSSSSALSPNSYFILYNFNHYLCITVQVISLPFVYYCTGLYHFAICVLLYRFISLCSFCRLFLQTLNENKSVCVICEQNL